jgi:hypothetical protein
MSTKKRVQFDPKKKVKKYAREEEDDDEEIESDQDNSDSESEKKKTKHSLDSDEEDNADKYKLLNREFMNGYLIN